MIIDVGRCKHASLICIVKQIGEYGKMKSMSYKTVLLRSFLHHVKLASSSSSFVFVAQLTQKPHTLSSI